jgi:hypothetical protein
VTLQNRVTPFGDLIAHPARGLLYGNRGCLHDAAGTVRRHHATRRWIACRLEFRGWQRGPMMQPGKFTELSFLDDATALAAGHRPCALCRREDYRRLAELWPSLHGERGTAEAIDMQLQRERLDGRARRLHVMDDTLPDGACVVRDGAAWMVGAGVLRRWAPAGYRDAAAIGGGPHRLLTPPSLLRLLLDGWRSELPLLHPSAGAAP